MKRSVVVVSFFLLGVFYAYPQAEIRKQLKDSIHILSTAPNFSQQDTVYIDLLIRLGSHMRYFDADSLHILAKQAQKYSKLAQYTRGESYAFLRLGDYHSDLGQNDRAINFYTKGLVLAQQIEDNDLALRIINNLAAENGYKGDYAKALSGYLSGIELAEKIGNKDMLSIMNENIASLYATQKDYDQALVYFKKVKKINDEIGNTIYQAETMSNLASLYADMGKLDYAMFNVNRSIAIFEKNNILDWLAYAYETKGKVYLKQQDFKWALFWYSQSELIHQDLEDDRSKIDLFNGMAEAYLNQGKDSISERYALQAFDISTRIKFLEGKQKCALTLYKIQKNKDRYEKALAYHEIFQNLSDSLHRNENKRSLTLLKTKTNYEQQRLALIEENERALATQQRYIYAALLILLIFILVTFLVHRNQKVQKKLNTELQAKQEILEKREKELNESNDTKNKLFSIIGHDLRGPIGALQELLKLFGEGEMGKDEFLDFIPKLREDIDHIFFTLNNLLSWGRTQMNGSVTQPVVLDLESLVKENVSLLSEVAKKKSIKIVNHIEHNTMIWSDSNQIDIVVRNLISNALKFTPMNGMVTIDAVDIENCWQISVKDTGVGMDKITLGKLFDKSANVSTYGTNNEKGTGLGLSLCKEMVENNKGQIWVESSINTGSSFYFTLPKPEARYHRAS
ncbi:MAG: tetratricopeptide repeat-containing sensor histidine kinase [Flavobacteriaceae bacterium]